MLTGAQLATWLKRHPATTAGSVVALMDKRVSISSQFVRAVWEGAPAMAVGSDVPTSAAAAALVDLVAWQLVADPDASSVTLILAGGRPEVVDAARTLRASLRGQLAAKIVVLEKGESALVIDDGAAPNFSASPHACRWSILLNRWREASPSDLAYRLVELVDHPSVRLSPMLSRDPIDGEWSVRLDGLEVGQVGTAIGTLDIGKTSAAGQMSFARNKWLEISPIGGRTFDKTTVEKAACALRTLISKFETDGSPVLDHRQPEHALESAVLRGVVQVVADQGPLVPWSDDGLVSRGSQFPTLWTESGRARYLDALLRDGDVPWAIELKVLNGGGSGAYYRHGLAQAVLYRHFIRSAAPVHSWFKHAGTEASQCRAAVGFPKAPEQAAGRIAALRQLGEIFDVQVIELDTTPADVAISTGLAAP